MVAKVRDVGTRRQVLCLLESGVKMADIIKATELSQLSIYRPRTEAIKRGYNKEISPKLFLSYVQDAPRSGRPKKCTEAVADEVVKIISKTSTTRELSAQAISNKLLPEQKHLSESQSVSLHPKRTISKIVA
jgi:hypothetical protein